MKKIEKCPYCEGTNFGIGYQVGQATIGTTKMGFSGSRVIHTICRKCGTIVHSCVEKPTIYKEDAK